MYNISTSLIKFSIREHGRVIVSGDLPYPLLSFIEQLFGGVPDRDFMFEIDHKVYMLKNLESQESPVVATRDPEDLENAFYGYLQSKKLYEIVSQTDPNFFKDSPSASEMQTYLSDIQTCETGDGFAIIKKERAEFWFNKGQVGFLGNIDGTFHRTISAIQDKIKNIRVAPPIYFGNAVDSTIFTHHVGFQCPNKELGKPFYADLFDDLVDQAYIEKFIDQTGEVINAIRQCSDVFPDEAIRFEQRLTDSQGHYFVLYTPRATKGVGEFVMLQFDYLEMILTQLAIPEVDVMTMVYYARSKWII
jgi:hypothetical protein